MYEGGSPPSGRRSPGMTLRGRGAETTGPAYWRRLWKSSQAWSVSSARVPVTRNCSPSRGKRLIEEAALLLYAGSMIPPALLDLASPRASVIDAAPLDLEECHSLMLQFARAGQPVVHLHTGDPAVYSALREQLALLDRDGIPWQVVPGITAASAAAAAAGCSFTVPGATQSLIMTRMPGRTPMPEQEALRHLAKHGTTLAVYLSAMQARAMQEELEQSLPAATPVICAFRLGWPDQQLIRTRLDLLAETIEKNGLSRQTVVLVLPGEGEDAPVPRTCGPHTDHD